jgi:hypothetical protein
MIKKKLFSDEQLFRSHAEKKWFFWISIVGTFEEANRFAFKLSGLSSLKFSGKKMVYFI